MRHSAANLPTKMTIDMIAEDDEELICEKTTTMHYGFSAPVTTTQMKCAYCGCSEHDKLGHNALSNRLYCSTDCLSHFAKL